MIGEGGTIQGAKDSFIVLHVGGNRILPYGPKEFEAEFEESK